MATLWDRNIFQVSRDEVEKEINQIIQSLNRKKTELMTEINSLETEHNNARKQKQNDVLKLTNLKTQTEELGQNNLAEIQNNLLGEIQSGIDKLSLEFNTPPDFGIKIEWEKFREYFRAIIDIPKIVKVITVNEDPNGEASDNEASGEAFDSGSNDEDSEVINWGYEDCPLTAPEKPAEDRRRFYKRNDDFRDSRSSHFERNYGDRNSGGFVQRGRNVPRQNSRYNPPRKSGHREFMDFDRGETRERRSGRPRNSENRGRGFRGFDRGETRERRSGRSPNSGNRGRGFGEFDRGEIRERRSGRSPNSGNRGREFGEFDRGETRERRSGRPRYTGRYNNRHNYS